MSSRRRLEALFDAHHQRLLTLALRLAGHRDDALDLVQETFLRAARRSGSIPSLEPHAERWLVRVLVNLVRDRWRQIARRGTTATLPSTAQAYDATAAATLARLIVTEALAALPPRRRTIVVLAELEGKNSPEIAALLGMSAVTVRWHLSAARQQLRVILADHSEAGPDKENDHGN